jgi:hypothetical protein
VHAFRPCSIESGGNDDIEQNYADDLEIRKLSNPRQIFRVRQTYDLMMRTLSAVVLIASCSPDRSNSPTSVAPLAAPAPPSAIAGPSGYQLRWGGMSVRDGDRLVDAPAEDVVVVRGYPAWPFKGPEVDHVRLTVMTAKTSYAVGEPIRVLHVLDVSVPGRGVYVMGPKQPTGEYLDGQLATGNPESPDYPWVGTYDGVVLPSPAIDYNYDITSYQFGVPGTHAIQWRRGMIASNVITVDVR